MKQCDIELHAATESDIDMIVDMRALFAEELAGTQDPALENKLRQNLKEYFAEELNKTCLCCYAKVKEEVVSIAVMALRKQPGNIKNPSGKWGYLMIVFTLPDYRAKGISTLVLNKIMLLAASYGITAFELHATISGEPVYQKLGFKKHSEPTYHKFIDSN